MCGCAMTFPCRWIPRRGFPARLWASSSSPSIPAVPMRNWRPGANWASVARNGELAERAAVQPPRAIRSQFRDRAFFVNSTIFRAQHVAPAAIDALMDKGLRPAVPEGAAQRNRGGGIRLHIVEAAMVEDVGPFALVDCHTQESGNAPDLARHVLFEIF